MLEPDFILSADDRTKAGSLKSAHLSEAFKTLDARGFILLPSDTCYSLAAFARSRRTKEKIDGILSRKGDPISLCCSSYEEACAWVEPNMSVFSLLEAFTPGPITVVCKPAKEFAKKMEGSWFQSVIGSPDQTLGIRIPDSIVEREVAATTNRYLLTTPAVRDSENRVVRDFDLALAIVREGIRRTDTDARWGAIRGNEFYNKESTVVRVRGDGTLEKIREGDIPFELIKAQSRIMPARVPAGSR
jgi:L-threonylcarbamoyladenylate synthase